MLSHDDIIQRALENAGHRKRIFNIYMYKNQRIFSASHNLRISACLFHIKYNVEPDEISRIMYLMSLVARAMKNEPLHEKTCLSGLASLKKQVDLSYACADPEVRTPPPGNSQVLY